MSNFTLYKYFFFYIFTEREAKVSLGLFISCTNANDRTVQDVVKFYQSCQTCTDICQEQWTKKRLKNN